MTVRTRFAPSPTGYLHLGGARTALFNYLYARRHGGRFLLRIEDTDLERSTLESINAILEGMTWLGLEYDEGPFYQTQRFDRYNQVIDRLLEQGRAYRCRCSRERLDALRDAAMERHEKPRYDGHCRDLPVSADEPHVVRFRTPAEGVVMIEDLVQGRVEMPNSELDDLIIRRSDGAPTYNLSVVVDDIDMEITHVIRGVDHLNNTPRQIHIYQGLERPLPAFAHVPMIHGADGAKLSKRHGAVSVVQYRDEGFLPEALLNYLVRLGWSHGDQEVFSLDQMIELFDIAGVNKAASIFNRDKLSWLNQQYLKVADPLHVAHLLSPHLGHLDIDPSGGPPVVEVVKVQQDRAKTLIELAEISAFFYKDFVAYEPVAASRHLVPGALSLLENMRDRLLHLDPWTPEDIHQAVAEVAAQAGVNMGKVAQPLRVAVVGRAASPGIDVTLHLLGKDPCLRRIEQAIGFIQHQVS